MHTPATEETAATTSDPANSRADQEHEGAARPWVVDARGLRKDFGGTQVLRDLSLQVRPGEICRLIGPSGSGKSTTIHLLCGHLRPSAGTITVLGEEPIRFTAATRRRIGYMPQEFVLYPDLTIEQNINFTAGLYGMPEWRGSRCYPSHDAGVAQWQSSSLPSW